MDEALIITKKITEYFAHLQKIDTVLLFGSFAKNTFTSKSDVDIAIHSKNPITIENLVSMQTDLSDICRREIDLVDLSKAEGIFLHQIVTTGIKIKIDSNVFHHYLMKALYFYEDFLPILRSVQKEKIRRFINGQ
jgi:predicted nucleotidyltransferase